MPFLNKIFSKKSDALYMVLAVLAISGAIIIYYLQGNSTQTSLTEQMLHREQVIVRAGALSIDDFLIDVGRSVSMFSNCKELTGTDKKATETKLNIILNEWSNTPVVAVVTLDQKGILTEDVNQIQMPDLGTNLSGRGYFQWSENAQPGSYFIHDPIVSQAGQTEGEYIIPIATPLFDTNGNFKGTLVAIVSLRKLVEKYVEPLRISESTDIYMLNSNADLVFSTVPQYLGKNLNSITNSMEFRGKDKLQKIFQNEFVKPVNEGKLDVNLPDINGGEKTVRSLVAYSGVKAGVNSGSTWYLVISTPANDAFLFTGLFYADQLTSLIYCILVVIGFSIVGLTSAKFMRR